MPPAFSTKIQHVWYLGSFDWTDARIRNASRQQHKARTHWRSDSAEAPFWLHRLPAVWPPASYWSLLFHKMNIRIPLSQESVRTESTRQAETIVVLIIIFITESSQNCSKASITAWLFQERFLISVEGKWHVLDPIWQPPREHLIIILRFSGYY